MALNPWDEGYVAPEFDVQQIYSDRAVAAVTASNAVRAERRREAEQENPGLSDGELHKIVNSQSKVGQRLATRTEEALTPEQRELYQDFAVEYLFDFNAPLALIRAGGKPKSAAVRGPQMLRTPYVQQLIKLAMDSLEEENLVTRKQIIMGLWREANDQNEGASGGARVRALMGLARIKQMDVKVVETKATVQHNVMHVPMAVDNDSWAQAAEQSQQALKSDVRT